MTIQKKFKEIASYQSTNFVEWFGEMEYKQKSSLLFNKKLERNMTDQEILKEFQPTDLEIGEVFSYLENRAKKKDLMIFYVKDIAGVLRAVGVYWRDGGWGVDAFSVEDPSAWDDGYQVFSRNFFDTLNPSPSEPLKLSPFENLQKIKNLVPVLIINISGKEEELIPKSEVMKILE